jgi:cellulose synthase/poly-beta-1,6-N-acetylglucosamine synthase-like glycosyltransferase
MLDFVVGLLLSIYGVALCFILFHSLSDAHLIYHYLVTSKKKKRPFSPDNLQPSVTIQLPVYNEVYVAERLIDAVAAIDYLVEKLEIQVLDDSTDETTDVIARKVTCLQKKGINIQHIRRERREGFKAGALKHGLSLAQGEFIAIFDADFVPAKDFLQKAVPYFRNSQVGMVQTKWGHINKDASLFTSLQALALDGHFSIEQTGRNAAGYFINFNGTGGVWRKACILDAGNWQADTLTEDLDLSYRAQLKGWQFVYLEDVTSPAELPPVMSAFKSQQFRWAKGGAETARKNMKALLHSNLPFWVKWHGAFHLIYSFGFVSIIICAVLAIPILFIKEAYPQYNAFFGAGTILYACFFIYILHYFICYFINTEGSFIHRILGFLMRFPLFVALFIGISLNNAIGIIKGYAGIKTAFIRTPKFNLATVERKAVSNKYTHVTINWVTIAEGLLAVYFLFGLLAALQLKNFAIVPFFLMSILGFSVVFIMSMQERLKKQLKQSHE